jgi:outer membrane protein TolC
LFVLIYFPEVHRLDDVLPENKLEQTISATLKINQLITDTISIENHPKINSLENKLAILEVDRKLKANSLLPKMDVGYHYLSEPNYWNDTNFNNYKIGVNFKFPLFLRKERGSLQLAKFKIQDTQFSLNLERVQLKNKINAQQTEIKSIEKQLQLLSSLVAGNSQMLQSEERLFSLGESSIFLLNSRENNLVSIQLTQLGLENRFLNSNAELFKIMANPD